MQFLFFFFVIEVFLALKWEVECSSAAKCYFNITHATITSAITFRILNYMLSFLSSVWRLAGEQNKKKTQPTEKPLYSAVPTQQKVNILPAGKLSITWELPAFVWSLK